MAACQCSASNLSYQLTAVSGFDVLLINCCSVKNKTELAALLKTLNSDTVIGNESWLDDTILSLEVFPADYEGYCEDGNTLSRGVFLLVRMLITSFMLVALIVKLFGAKLWFRKGSTVHISIPVIHLLIFLIF